MAVPGSPIPVPFHSTSDLCPGSIVRVALGGHIASILSRTGNDKCHPVTFVSGKIHQTLRSLADKRCVYWHGKVTVPEGPHMVCY